MGEALGFTRREKTILFIVVFIFLLSLSIFAVGKFREKGQVSSVWGSGDNRVVVVVLDGADWRIIKPLVDQGRLPIFKSFMQEGSYGTLTAVDIYSSPNMASIFSGKLPSEHGVGTHFYLDGDSQELKQTMISQMRVPPVWKMPSINFSVAVLSFVETPTAEDIDNVMVSSLLIFETVLSENGIPIRGPGGIDYLSLLRDRTLVYPRSLFKSADAARSIKNTSNEMNARGIWEKFFSPVSERMVDSIIFALGEGASSENYSASMLTSAIRDVLKSDKSAKVIYDYDAATHALAIGLLKGKASDAYFIYFMGTDTFSHMYYLDGWLMNDTSGVQEQLYRYYETIDSYLGDIVQYAGENSTIIVVSDHGTQNVSFDEYEKIKKLVPISKNPRRAPHTYGGIILAKGNGIKKGHVIEKSSTVDILPTALCLLGSNVNMSYFANSTLLDISSQPMERRCRVMH